MKTVEINGRTVKTNIGGNYSTIGTETLRDYQERFHVEFAKDPWKSNYESEDKMFARLAEKYERVTFYNTKGGYGFTTLIAVCRNGKGNRG